MAKILDAYEGGKNLLKSNKEVGKRLVGKPAPNPFVIYESQMNGLTEWEFWNCNFAPDYTYFEREQRIQVQQKREEEKYLDSYTLKKRREREKELREKDFEKYKNRRINRKNNNMLTPQEWRKKYEDYERKREFDYFVNKKKEEIKAALKPKVKGEPDHYKEPEVKGEPDLEIVEEVSERKEGEVENS